MKRLQLLLAIFLFCALGLNFAYAENSGYNPSANFLGTVGLNTIPSARMEKPGTVRISGSAAEPFLHTQIGLQIHDRLYLGLRQTVEGVSIREKPDQVYPGMDIKFKLLNEGSSRPETVIGLQSAFGHRRMATEYLAFSKRYEDWDFTAGLGWGRLGTRQQIPNPLLVNRFRNNNRSLAGEGPASPSDWFRGDVGIFAGVEYNLPWHNLSLKADLTSDDYKAEKQADPSFKTPGPFALSLNYTPSDYIDAGIGVMGTDILLARLSLKTNFLDWPYKPAQPMTFLPVTPRRNDILPDRKGIAKEADKYGLYLKNTREDGMAMRSVLYLEPFQTTPRQLGQGWRIMANNSSIQNEALDLTPVYLGLKGQSLSINRRDLEQEAAKHHGSAEEIWRNLSAGPSSARIRPVVNIDNFYATLKQEVSPSEEDNGILYRSGLIVTHRHQFATYFIDETSVRANLHQNLQKLHQNRPYNNDPIRGDIDKYSAKPFALERSYFKGFKTLAHDLHASLGIGYLEELFAGLQTEILYRPFNRNWAVAADIASVRKRDFEDGFNLGFTGPFRNSALLHAYYEIPNTDFTVSLDAGRYLAGDMGAGLTLKNEFANGATLEAFVTATNKNDPDVYGDDSNIYSGLRFSLPLGNLKYIPDGSSIDVVAAPFGRDAGQKLDTPHPLYKTTEPLSYRHLVRNWAQVAE